MASEASANRENTAFMTSIKPYCPITTKENIWPMYLILFFPDNEEHNKLI